MNVVAVFFIAMIIIGIIAVRVNHVIPTIALISVAVGMISFLLIFDENTEEPKLLSYSISSIQEENGKFYGVLENDEKVQICDGLRKNYNVNADGYSNCYVPEQRVKKHSKSRPFFYIEPLVFAKFYLSEEQIERIERK